MKFSHTYFEDEVRSGFFVPGMVKRAWAAQLEVLNVVDRICKKYHLQYFAEWGTLLGAVRHQGFIPWDDDLDICMKRQDYNKFIRVAQEELPEGFNFGNVYTDVGFTDMLSRIMNERTIRLDAEFLDKYHQFPYVAGLDIFPLDFIAPREEDNAFQLQMLDIVATFANAIDCNMIEWGEITPYIEQIEQMCNVRFDRTKPLQQQLFILVDRLSGLYTEEEAKDITLMTLWKDGQTYKFPKEYYAEAVWLPFENTQIPVPVAYDEILRRKYGDYMRLVKGGGSHDYPFFSRQEQILEEQTGIKMRKYVFCREDAMRSEDTLVERGNSKKEIVFLTYEAAKWPALESLWKAACEDPETEVFVMPVPYFERKFTGDAKAVHYERDMFPEYVKTVSFEEYDLKEHHPDVIIVQDPCDEFNPTISIHPDFYSRVIRNYTNKLVYVPWFVLDEFDEQDERAFKNMDNYVTMPGLVCADYTFVQSEKMKQTYIRKLTEWAGEETRPLWEEKLLPIGVPLMDYLEAERQKKIAYPKEWEHIIYKPDGSKKRVMLYATNASGLVEHGEKVLQKLESVMHTFYEHRDEIALIWRPHPKTREFSEHAAPELWAKYEAIVLEYQTAGWGIYDDGWDEETVVAVADAYYGDSGNLAHLCGNANKPVMIQNVNI